MWSAAAGGDFVICLNRSTGAGFGAPSLPAIPPRAPHSGLSGLQHGAADFSHAVESSQGLGGSEQFNTGLCGKVVCCWKIVELVKKATHTHRPEASRGLVTDVRQNWIWVFRIQYLSRQ